MVESIKAQTIDHVAWLVADYGLPNEEVRVINSYRPHLKPIWVDKGWLESLRNLLPDGERKITTTIPGGAVLKPEALALIEDQYIHHLPFYYIKHGPGISLVESGNRTCFAQANTDRWINKQVSEWIYDRPSPPSSKAPSS